MSRSKSSKKQLSEIAQLPSCEELEEDLEMLKGIFHRLAPDNDGVFENRINTLKQLLCSILPEDEKNIPRPFNIYVSTSKGQFLIADQIPAIIFSELIEKRANGITKDLLPVTFQGFSGRYANYVVNNVKSSLYYLDTQKKIKQMSSEQDKETLIDSYLKYIDLCMTTALLTNDRMVSSEKEMELVSSNFGEQMNGLANEVKALGFDLPGTYHKLMQSVG